MDGLAAVPATPPDRLLVYFLCLVLLSRLVLLGEQRPRVPEPGQIVDVPGLSRDLRDRDGGMRGRD